MKIHTLYKTTNIKNGKFYIGVHTTNDVGFGTDSWIDPYVGSGKLVLRVLKRYGRSIFDVEVIAYFDNEDFAYDAERDLVTEELVKSRKCYNTVLGGGKPPIITSEIARVAQANRKLNGNGIEGDRNPAKRPEVRAAISIGQRGRRGSLLGRKGEYHPAFGRPAWNKGKKVGVRSEETKMKIAATLKGKRHPPERVEANRRGQLKRYRGIE